MQALHNNATCAARCLLTSGAHRWLAWISGSLLWLACFGVTPSLAQDLGEIARQQRAQKQSQPHRTTHVYTEEELARPKILTPEDRARFAAAQDNGAVPKDAQIAAVPPAEPQTPEVSLGEIARRYRLQKQARNSRFGLPPAVTEPTVLATPSFARPPTMPAPVAKTTPAIPPAEPGTMTKVWVRRGDSLWKLAKQYLGRGSDWPRLVVANPELSPSTPIRAGDWIRLPQRPSSVGSRREYRVKPGDSLWKLARAAFGSGQAWSCIHRVNPQVRDPNLIHIGQRLLVPDYCGPGT